VRISLFRVALRRLLIAIPVIIGGTILVFAAGRIATPNPSTTGLSIHVTPEQRELFIKERHLDDPLPVQYVVWLTNALQGNFGRSLTTGQQISATIFSSLKVSAELASGAFILSALGGFGLGMLAGLRGGVIDRLIAGLSALAVAIPGFWLGLVLIFVLAVWLGVLPAGGYVSPDKDLIGFLRSMLLPWVTLAVFPIAVIARVMRARVIEEMSKPYIRTAFSLGVSRYRVITRYLFPNVLAEPLSLLGVHAGYMLGGVVLIEQVFNIPGLGIRSLAAANQGDFPAIQATALTAMVVLLLVNLVVDLIVLVIDPRLRERGMA
jgi:peptide/nickel transport system permease protein